MKIDETRYVYLKGTCTVNENNGVFDNPRRKCREKANANLNDSVITEQAKTN
jgi:hypothetical protein